MDERESCTLVLKGAHTQIFLIKPICFALWKFSSCTRKWRPLTGIIGALLAKGTFCPYESATLAVQWHEGSLEALARQHGQESIVPLKF